MLSYKQHERNTAAAKAINIATPGHRSVIEIASSNIAHGYSRLQSLDVTVRRSSSLHSIGSSTSESSSPSSSSPCRTSLPVVQPTTRHETATEIAARKVRELAEDTAVVERELSKYEAAGALKSFENTGMVNIVEFWSVSSLSQNYFDLSIFTHFFSGQ